MKKLIIWMIDDEPIYHKQAREGLANVAKQLPVTCVIKSSCDWQWPPELNIIGQDGTEKKDEQPLAQLPDILILDLFESAMTFRGKIFYEELRKHETKENRRLHQEREKNHSGTFVIEAEAREAQPSGAFVIIWSNYWSHSDSINFVKQARMQDNRFVAIETKAPSLLEEAVKGCISRIEEER